MSDVCVVTGGGSGMGLSAALQMPKDKIIIVSGRTISKLEKAVEQLKEGGHEAYACTCDTSDRESVKKLVEFAASKGTVRNKVQDLLRLTWANLKKRMVPACLNMQQKKGWVLRMSLDLQLRL